MSELSDRKDFVTGKRVAGKRYLHVSALEFENDATKAVVESAASLAQIQAGHNFNVVRLGDATSACALLSYPRFFEDPFPALQESWNVDLTNGRLTFRSYAESI